MVLELYIKLTIKTLFFRNRTPISDILHPSRQKIGFVAVIQVIYPISDKSDHCVVQKSIINTTQAFLMFLVISPLPP